jgi:hypothetical protein
MRDRSCLGALLLMGIVVPLTSCGVSPALTSITIVPSSITALLGPCGGPQVVANFTATGNYTRPGHAAVTKDITDQVTWYSYDTQLVVVSSGGVASVTTCATPGSTFQSSTQIRASAPGFHGDIIGYATFAETEPPPATGASQDITSLSLERSFHTGIALNDSVQFTAVGKTADGRVVELQKQPTWISSNPQSVTIDTATGLAQVIGPDRATMVAVYTNPDGTNAIGTARLSLTPTY